MRVSEALPKTTEPARPRAATERASRRDGTEPDVAGFAALLNGATRTPEPRPTASEERLPEDRSEARIDAARETSPPAETEHEATGTSDEITRAALRADSRESTSDDAPTAPSTDDSGQTSTTVSSTLASLLTSDDEVAGDSATTPVDLEIALSSDEEAEVSSTSASAPAAAAAKTVTPASTTFAADSEQEFGAGLGDAATSEAAGDLADATGKDGAETSPGVDVRQAHTPPATATNTNATPAAQEAVVSKIDALEAAPETKSSGTTHAAVLPEEAQRIFEQIKEQYRPGTNRLVFRLDPPEFGKLEIRLKLQRGRLVGEVVAESDSVARLLERDLDRLKSSLDTTGAAVDQWSFQSKEDPARFQKEGRFDSRPFDFEGRTSKAVAKIAPVATHTAPTSASERLNVMV